MRTDIEKESYALTSEEILMSARVCATRSRELAETKVPGVEERVLALANAAKAFAEAAERIQAARYKAWAAQTGAAD